MPRRRLPLTASMHQPRGSGGPSLHLIERRPDREPCESGPARSAVKSGVAIPLQARVSMTGMVLPHPHLLGNPRPTWTHSGSAAQVQPQEHERLPEGRHFLEQPASPSSSEQSGHGCTVAGSMPPCPTVPPCVGDPAGWRWPYAERRSAKNADAPINRAKRFLRRGCSTPPVGGPELYGQGSGCYSR
jgi:hypothetical protein